MRFSRAIPLLPLASALVILDSTVFEHIETSRRTAIDTAQNVLDGAFEKAEDVFSRVKDNAKDLYGKIHDTGYDIESWLDTSFDDGTDDFEDEMDEFEDDMYDFEDEYDHPYPPHDGPPHHGPPHDGPPHGGPPHGGPPHRGRPGDGPPRHGPPHHRKPHHPPHDEKPNRTVYELINESKYTTKLAKLINEYDDLVELLNGTKANYTVFAPTDKAFEKIPKHAKKPSKEFIKDILLYHVSDGFYPAGRVLHSYTIPTLYNSSTNLGHAQRLTVRVSLKGPNINWYSRLVALNIFGTNGVIHGLDSLLVPPPSVASIINLLPGEFSTLELGLAKTGLFDKINSTDYPHSGGTFFAPSNFAFRKLGERANAFLFSKYGEKYLKALLEYHIVVNQTLYTDAFYDATRDDSTSPSTSDDDCEEEGGPPYYHYDLPTVLDGKYLAVDVTRYGPFVSIRINGFSRVTIHDGVASDGVIQVVSDVLIPPRNAASEEKGYWMGGEIGVEELKERLEPYVEGVEENFEL